MSAPPIPEPTRAALANALEDLLVRDALLVDARVKAERDAETLAVERGQREALERDRAWQEVALHNAEAQVQALERELAAVRSRAAYRLADRLQAALAHVPGVEQAARRAARRLAR